MDIRIWERAGRHTNGAHLRVEHVEGSDLMHGVQKSSPCGKEILVIITPTSHCLRHKFNVRGTRYKLVTEYCALIGNT